MSGYDFVTNVLEETINSDKSLYHTDYIVHFRTKYKSDKDWEEHKEYVAYMDNYWEWQWDWYEGQDYIEILGFDMVQNLNITNRLPIISNRNY